MNEVNPEPRRYGKVVATALTGAAGAVALGLWQGLGSGMAGMVMSLVQTPAPAASPGSAATSSPVAVSSPATPHTASSTISTSKPDDDVMADVVRVRAPLSLSGIGKGRSETDACRAALDSLTDQAGHQCQQMVIEQKGTNFRVEGGNKECTGCAPLGDSWRCVASSTPQCVVTGEMK